MQERGEPNEPKHGKIQTPMSSIKKNFTQEVKMFIVQGWAKEVVPGSVRTRVSFRDIFRSHRKEREWWGGCPRLVLHNP